MVEKNSDLELRIGKDCVVHCKDCVSSVICTDNIYVCHYQEARSVAHDFFCKNGVRKKEPEKEITRDEKLDAIIEHIENRSDFSGPLYFRRNLTGKGIYLYSWTEGDHG